MEKDTLILSISLPVKPEELYDAWLSSEKHSAFTGSPASISAEKDGNFTAWNGYISGQNIELERPGRIRQSWRTTEFSDKDEDSLLEILFEPERQGTKLTIHHSNIPEGQGDGYKEGWMEYYFNPMKKHYRRKS